jgi:acyl carrier protein phosphodiesterase
VNFLAHLWLTDIASLPLAGAILGDHVRGRLDGQWPVALEASIKLHRRIDAATDRHAVIRTVREDFAPGHRRYAGIVLDLLCDHALANDWPSYSGESLDDFASRCGREIALQRAWFETAGLAVDGDRFAQLLLSYRSEAGIDTAIRRTAQRLSRPALLTDAARDWRQHLPPLKAALPVLLDDLRRSAASFGSDG